MGIDKILRAIFQDISWEQVGFIDIIAILLNAIKILLILGNTVAVGLLIWNAFTYINAYGSEEGVKKAKSGITAVITGVIIITISFFLVSFVYAEFVDTAAHPFPTTDINKSIPKKTIIPDTTTPQSSTPQQTGSTPTTVE